MLPPREILAFPANEVPQIPLTLQTETEAATTMQHKLATAPQRRKSRSTLTPGEQRTIASATITIGSFRRLLRDAGYPFREPVGIDKLLKQLDELLFPPEHY